MQVFLEGSKSSQKQGFKSYKLFRKWLDLRNYPRKELADLGLKPLINPRPHITSRVLKLCNKFETDTSALGCEVNAVEMQMILALLQI